eukprot:179557-Amphidinium_carterae.1
MLSTNTEHYGRWLCRASDSSKHIRAVCKSVGSAQMPLTNGQPPRVWSCTGSSPMCVHQWRQEV